jgi:hypothetical protein
MKKACTFLLCTIALALGVSTSVNAALFDRGNGMIYDDELDITWLQDANYAKTSGYHSSGWMDWYEANTWADNLVFRGYDDWRLPTTPEDGPAGYNITSSEMGHMFYNNLGGTSGDCDGYVNATFTDGNGNPGSFSNLRQDYWSGTEKADNLYYVWVFSFCWGNQGAASHGSERYAWAVRDGDVGTPEPDPDEVVGNNGFETGDMTGWETVENRGTATATDTENYSGDYSAELNLNQSCSNVQLRQIITVPDNGVFSIKYKIGPSFEGTSFGISLKDYSNIIGSYPDSITLLSTQKPETGGWQEKEWALEYLGGNDVEIVFYFGSSGTCNQMIDASVYIDDVSFTSAEEPIAYGIDNSGFEQGLDHWFTSEKYRGEVSLTSDAYNGDSAGKLYLPYYCDDVGLNQRFIVPDADAKLKFMFKPTGASDGYISVRIEDFSELNENEWSNQISYTIMNPIVASDWTAAELDLTELAGHYVELKFVLGSSGGCANSLDVAVYLDDVTLECLEDIDCDGVLDGVDNCQFNNAMGQDANGDGCIDVVEDLPEVIEELNLPQGIENNLTSTINSAMKSLSKGNKGAAVNQLKAFINKVSAQKGKKIPIDDADMLIGYATNLINSL